MESCQIYCASATKNIEWGDTHPCCTDACFTPSLRKFSHERCGNMTNEELVAQIQAGIDTAANMALLWQQNRPLIGQIAGRYNHYAEEDDLIQEGYIGLCDAVDGYSPEGGAKFMTYAVYWIRQRMRRYIQNNAPVHISAYRQEYLWKYQRFVQWFREYNGKEPEIREIADYLGLGYKDIHELEKYLKLAKSASLDRPVDNADGATLGDLIPGNTGIEDDIIDREDMEILRGVLWPMVDELPKNQAVVIRARYQENLTLKEAGQRIGSNAEKARQYQEKGLRELRRPKYAKWLRPFLQDYIDTHAYSGCGVSTFNRTWTSSTERTAIDMYG